MMANLLPIKEVLKTSLSEEGFFPQFYSSLVFEAWKLQNKVHVKGYH